MAYTRVALFELPRRVGITGLSAYSADGTLTSYAIPYQSPDAAEVAMWYGPGEKPTIREASGTITGRTATGAPASVQVHIGPFGICYTVQRAEPQFPVTNCTPPDATAAGEKTLRSGDAVPASLPAWVALGGEVSRNVDHVDFEVTSGTYRAQPVHIGDYTFAVCFLDPGFSFVSRTLYDASGTVLDHETATTKP